MVPAPPPTLTLEAAGELQRRLHAEIGPGLGERELDDVEARFGFRFAADHRTFLAAGLPHGSRCWPDWRHGDPDDLRARLTAPVEGVLFDVEHNGFWHPLWGPKPDGTREALRIARAELATVPQLVPVYGHRYLPGTAGESGHPVLSVHQTDLMYYGNDLAHYVRNEFTGRPGTLSRVRTTVAFWSYFVDGETTFTTPHDPYAVTAREAVEHLRMLALERLIGRRVDEDQLVRTGLTAEALGVEAPSLPLLAGLPYGDRGRAPELFDRVLAELGLTAGLPGKDTGHPWEAARRELVHWWLRLIVNGGTAPTVGAEVIAHGGWGALGRPRALWPLVTLDVGCDGPTGERIRTFEELGAAIVAEAERLLAGPWSPHGPR
ncbi:hypothetical protein AB0F71_12260 [Kitasatospora sp. NPDC028055]|uniref:hypothetical protein n=1 Tax=Kitasatospora sp. NPDC028055 TaxID=3155653 RepID=UPI0033D7BC41